MRYLAQLARETNARVLPRRSPSWAPAIPEMAHENIVEWPAFNSPSLNPPPKPAPLDTTPLDQTPRDAAQREPQDPQDLRKLRIEPGPPASAPLALDGPASPMAQRPADPHPSLRAERTAEPMRAQPAELRASSPKRELELPEARDAVHPNPPADLAPSALALRPRDATEPSRADPPMNLSRVLAEIARKQELLEARYRAGELSETASARPGARSTAAAIQPAATRIETEEVRLSIGSIVVEVEPPPTPPSQAPTSRPSRSARDQASRWARSFLDR
jgi:hypothetical protein